MLCNFIQYANIALKQDSTNGALIFGDDVHACKVCTLFYAPIFNVHNSQNDQCVHISANISPLSCPLARLSIILCSLIDLRCVVILFKSRHDSCPSAYSNVIKNLLPETATNVCTLVQAYRFYPILLKDY